MTHKNGDAGRAGSGRANAGRGRRSRPARLRHLMLALLLPGTYVPFGFSAEVTPTAADVPYGPHERQKLDFYRAPSDKPTPLLFVIHGGGWCYGDKRGEVTPKSVARYHQAGISVVSINYRYLWQSWDLRPPVKGCMEDAARGLQFVRSKAKEWNIDKSRICATGGSAGACSALWLAFHDDLADLKSDDPVARESTRLCSVAVVGGQTSLDPRQLKEWTPNSRYGGHAFGFMEPRQWAQTRDSRFGEFLAHREELLPLIKEYSPYELLSRDDPPVYLSYDSSPALGQRQKDPTHTANFGVKLQERCRELGVSCELVYPCAPHVRHPDIDEFIVESLASENSVSGDPVLPFDHAQYSFALVPAAKALDLPAVPPGHFGIHGPYGWYTWLEPGRQSHRVMAAGASLKYTLSEVAPEKEDAEVSTGETHLPFEWGKRPMTVPPTELKSAATGLHFFEITGCSGPSWCCAAAGEYCSLPAARVHFNQSSDVYFYVPKGTAMVAGEATSASGLMKDDSGQVVFEFSRLREDIGKKWPAYFMVPVPAGRDGALWKMEDIVGMRALYTVPPYYGLTAEGLLLPQEVVERDRTRSPQ